ncbi:acyl carrier protein [Amycolatopsis circi]|uniref:acyl carrier protein n=1 Tax=Amycolatopsis circi TaxID=871959 RepID=UPI000E256F5C|nr:acyl carrier protein [Amycolatopsis circi]
MDTRLNPREREQLYYLIREKLELGGAELDDTTMVRELPGVDSVKLLSLVGAVELGFQVNLGFEAIPLAQTVHDIEQLICESRERYATRAS